MRNLPSNNLISLLERVATLQIPDMQNEIDSFLERARDESSALNGLDHILGQVQSSLLTMSIYVKQRCLKNQIPSPTSINSDLYYTKQEVAIRFRVSIRTVTNWIISGLEVVNIGGVQRISHDSLVKFVKRTPTKKFNWKSPVKVNNGLS
jgi:hypothetical protein